MQGMLGQMRHLQGLVRSATCQTQAMLTGLVRYVLFLEVHNMLGLLMQIRKAGT